ncbi:MAG: hypothetical protein LBJ41_03470 [Treponema sp.]|jgi:hypothetical protein|nr:hypothetical protein [Treponema sp.]
MGYIPGKADKYVLFVDNFVPAVDTNKTAWGIPDAEVTTLKGAHTAFKTAFATAAEPATRTSVAVAVKNTAMAELTAQIRQMVEFRIRRNPVIDRPALIGLGLKPLDTHPTPIPDPDTIPQIEITMPAPRTLHIKFRAENAKRWGKPEGIHGIECLWVIADTPPAKIKDLLHSSFATKSPLELSFDEDERGKRVYFAVRWESGTVRKGKWSDVYNAIVP